MGRSASTVVDRDLQYQIDKRVFKLCTLRLNRRGARDLECEGAQLLAYAGIQLDVSVKAGTDCDEANRAGTNVHKM